jgi:adenine phosphoribosyltransferase
LLLDGPGFAECVERLAEGIGQTPDLIAATEARGFVFGAALAQRLGCGLLLIRKPGKLPGATIWEEYALEYGTDRLAIHVDACAPGAEVHLVDDLIATGGTALASMRLLRRAGARVSGASFVVDLPDLGGADLLRGEDVPVRALVPFAGH